jgi:hypothetical protein
MKRASVLFFGAAILTAGSLLAPLWGFRMSAPQYPGEALHLRVTPRAIAGDVHEISTLQKYIGVSFPTNLPELRWLPRAIALLAVLLAAGAFFGAGKAGRAVRWISAATLIIFLAASAALLQKRLYDVGHHRDPRAPIRSVHDFTPPVVGPVKVGNFTVWSYPHAGSALLALAGVLALAGASRPRPKGWAAA